MAISNGKTASPLYYNGPLTIRDLFVAHLSAHEPYSAICIDTNESAGKIVCLFFI